MNTDTTKGVESAIEEAPKNPEIRDQVKQLFLTAGFTEELGTTKAWGNSVLWLTHPSGRHVYIESDKNCESGWIIMIRGGLDKVQRGRIAKLLGKLRGEEDDNRRQILEGSGKFKLDALVSKADDGSETYGIGLVG